MGAEAGYVVGDAFVAVVAESVGGCVGSAVAHAVRDDDGQTEGGEERDLVAPAERDVWEAVDQDNGAALGC